VEKNFSPFVGLERKRRLFFVHAHAPPSSAEKKSIRLVPPRRKSLEVFSQDLYPVSSLSA